MEKKTLLALVVLIALGVGAVAVLRAPEKGQRTGAAPRPVATLKTTDIGQLEITTEKQESVSLAKSSNEWKVTAPAEWPADKQAVKSLTEALEKMSFGDIVTETAAKHEELGVADGKSQRVVVKDATGKLLADLHVGKTVAGFTMVRPQGKNEVWQATGLSAYLINRDAKGWRDHTVMSFSSADVERLTVESGGDKLVLDKVKEGEWKIAESTGAAPKGSDLDQQQATSATQTLGALQAADFAEGKSPEETGLEHPAVKLTVKAKDKEHVLLVGNTRADDVFVTTPDSKVAYVVKKYLAERVAKRPIDYRDKTILKAKESEIATVEIRKGAESTALEHSGETWKLKGKPLDAEKIKPVVSAFENVVATSFSPEKDANKTGLAKPSGTVTVRTKDQQATTLKVGSQTKEEEYYVQKVGTPDIYMVKKYIVDRFLKKPSDLLGPPSEPKKPSN